MKSFAALPVALTVFFGSTSMAIAHDPEDGQPDGDAYHQHDEDGHEGVYDHGHEDGHHHHPHTHAPARPAPRRAAPPRAPYAYRYGPNGGYPSGGYASGGYAYDGKPRVIEGWEPGDPIPDGYRPDTRARSGLVKAGAATLFSIWGLTAVVGSFMVLAEDIDDDDGVDGNGISPEDYYPLFIPVAGPFITIGTAETDRAGTMALIANGVAQSAGLAMFVAGLAAQKDVLVRIPTYGQASVELQPLIGNDIQGVGVKGSF